MALLRKKQYAKSSLIFNVNISAMLGTACYEQGSSNYYIRFRDVVVKVNSLQSVKHEFYSLVESYKKLQNWYSQDSDTVSTYQVS